MLEYMKTGYLNHDFKIFHLEDNGLRDFYYHYHDFHKILIFLKGEVSYHVEGKAYQLDPYDIVLIQAGEVHKPQVEENSSYERIILYVSPEFLDNFIEDGHCLSRCFSNATANNSNVLRIPSFQNSHPYKICRELEQAFHSIQIFPILYQKSLFIQFMIHLNRLSIQEKRHYRKTYSSNQKILAILNYINANLTSDISADTLSQQFYISKYYLMHLFKEETGYTIGNYLSTKRLLYARSLIENGMSVTEACYASGYHNYSTFSRAYKKLFSHSAGTV